MSPFLSRTVVVTPLPTKHNPLFYRAKYKSHIAYGRTAKEAVDRVSTRYYKHRITMRTILNAIGISLLPF